MERGGRGNESKWWETKTVAEASAAAAATLAKEMNDLLVTMQSTVASTASSAKKANDTEQISKQNWWLECKANGLHLGLPEKHGRRIPAIPRGCAAPRCNAWISHAWVGY